MGPPRKTQDLYDAWFQAHDIAPKRVLSTLKAMRAQRSKSGSSGFTRIATLRKALEALDKQVSVYCRPRSLKHVAMPTTVTWYSEYGRS